MDKRLTVADLHIGAGAPLAIIAGPCVIEDRETTFEIASYLKSLTDELNLPFLFKASFDKANRTSIQSYRGPGLEKGLEILLQIKKELDIRILSDVHETQQLEPCAKVLDVIQIPAFLCRQTDFLLAAAKLQKPINVKKGQFLAPWDVINIIEKIRSTGNTNIALTERGAMFGYNNLVVDFRGIPIMQSFGCPVIFDATHSVQLPGGFGASSGGQREHAPTLARAAVAAGADGLFLEVHPQPDKALCDGPNSLPLNELSPLLKQLKTISQVVRS
ncbi:MAG: 3-deoxy-8-phosphooctulonate synthase [Desulfobacteraceae bacterium]|jgi:2-dehydro-3-deoxyphosphooctonate aldolase (KDO 8-P synthase)